MGLREHLEEQIVEDLKILKKYEDNLRYEVDPILQRKWNARIKELKQLILEREEELKSINSIALSEDGQEKAKRQSDRIIISSLETYDVDFLSVDKSGQVVKRKKGKSQYINEDLGNGISLQMNYIPEGKFLMGTEYEEIERLVQTFSSVSLKNFKSTRFRREKPRHVVNIKSFFISKFLINQAQWKNIASFKDLKSERNLIPNPSRFKGDNRPVENVSWDDAVEFCNRLSKLIVILNNFRTI